jgi:hypothetical protein
MNKALFSTILYISCLPLVMTLQDTEPETHSPFRTDDGFSTCVKNTGIKVAASIGRGRAAPASEYYFRTSLKFEAPGENFPG